jgi:hypothetical protein
MSGPGATISSSRTGLSVSEGGTETQETGWVLQPAAGAAKAAGAATHQY